MTSIKNVRLHSKTLHDTFIAIYACLQTLGLQRQTGVQTARPGHKVNTFSSLAEKR